MKTKGMDGLRPGLIGTVEATVSEQHTAAYLGSGRLPVLATPAMIALMEAAAQRAVDEALPDGFQTVGAHLDVRHDGMTPVGRQVVATAEVTAIEGRILHFRLTAHDGKELIGEGSHQRVLSATAVLERLLRQKKGGIA